MNNGPKMFSNNPRTLANRRAKEKRKGVKLCDRYANQFGVYKSRQLRTLWASKGYKTMSTEQRVEAVIDLINKLDGI